MTSICSTIAEEYQHQSKQVRNTCRLPHEVNNQYGRGPRYSNDAIVFEGAMCIKTHGMQL